MDKLKKSEGRKKGDLYNTSFCIFGNELATHFVPKHNYGDLVIFDLRDERFKIF